MLVREERDGDGETIANVVAHAFGRADEAQLVARLRQDGDAVLSLVAVHDDAIIGHVLLSPMAAPFRALGLAPLSVLPRRQRQGVGTALMRAAIEEAKGRGWSAVFVLGDPACYRRFGFRAHLAAGFSSPYAGPHLMVLPLQGALPVPEGRIDYAPAFAGMA